MANGSPGRPPADIDWDKVATLCSAGCFGTSIAHEIGITEETLYRRCQKDNQEDFSAFRLRHLARGDDVIRAKQFDLAVKGDKAMLIWLGKNRLNQRDRQEIQGQVNYTPPVISITVQADRNGPPPDDGADQPPADTGG